MDIGAWLSRLGLERYETAFRRNDIDAEILPKLTTEDLISIGITSVGHRRKLLEAAALLQVGDAGQEPQKLPQPEGDRREVVVLFADLVGYTALSRQLDPEEIHALLQRFFDTVDSLIKTYGGHIDKHMGDCVMAVFGAPTSHGNDIERAVSASLAIQAAMPALSSGLDRQVLVHIGVAGGQVVASGSGSAAHRAYTVTGETVNLASRLTDAALAGEILISDAIWRALPGRLECEDRSELLVKGFARPVRAWRLLEFRRETTPRQRPLVGRAVELQHFEAALSVCRNRGRGQAIYIRGEAGIGKTRLLEEFQAAAQRAGFASHGGLVLDFGMGTARDAVRGLVRSLLGLVDSSDRIAVEATVQRAMLDGLVSVDRRVYLNDLLDVPQPIELRTLCSAMENEARSRGKRDTIVELIMRASNAQPRLLIIEDIHWADRVILEQLASLTETVADCPAILAMTSRAEGDPLDNAWRASVKGSPLTTLDLGPLRVTDAEVLAGGYRDALGEVVEQCISRAEGNPLFLDQLLRHAEESTESGLPASIQGLVQARLDRLPPMEKQALQAASVLGQRFTEAALGALLDQSGHDCTTLVRHFLLRPQEDHFLFAHALIQEGVYRSLLKGRRRELHRRAATWFKTRDPTLHAEHLDRADDAGAAAAYLAAARSQATEYRAGRALQLIERGLAIARLQADIFALTLFYGETLRGLGSIQDSIAAFERALGVANDDIERCRALLGLAAGMRVTDRFDEAFTALAAAETMASSNGLVAELATIHHLRGNLYFPLARLNECLVEHELALELARKIEDPELEARALGGLGDAEYARGRMASAHGNFSRCVELARTHGFGRIEVANLSMIAHTQLYLNDLSGALSTSIAAIELAARVGHPRAEIIAHDAAMNVYYMDGNLKIARRSTERRGRLIQALGALRFEPLDLESQAMIACAEGRLLEGSELMQRSLASCRRHARNFLGPWLLGHFAAMTDDPHARQEALVEGEAILSEGAVGHNHLWFYRYAIQASLNGQEWGEAERYAEALESYTRLEPLPWADFFINLGRALAAHGRDGGDQETAFELNRLRDKASRLNLTTVLPIIEQALAGK